MPYETVSTEGSVSEGIYRLLTIGGRALGQTDRWRDSVQQQHQWYQHRKGDVRGHPSLELRTVQPSLYPYY